MVSRLQPVELGSSARKSSGAGAFAAQRLRGDNSIFSKACNVFWRRSPVHSPQPGGRNLFALMPRSDAKGRASKQVPGWVVPRSFGGPSPNTHIFRRRSLADRAFGGVAIPGANSILSRSCRGFSGRLSPVVAAERLARSRCHPFPGPSPDQVRRPHPLLLRRGDEELRGLGPCDVPGRESNHFRLLHRNLRAADERRVENRGPFDGRIGRRRLWKPALGGDKPMMPVQFAHDSSPPGRPP